MVDENKNQDFIETPDEFVEAMDDNFGTPNDPMADDHIIDVDATPEPLLSENEWVDDYDDEMDTVFDGDEDLAQLVQKPQKNWFNIALFGGVALVICGVLYTYLPAIMGGDYGADKPQGGVAVQNQNLVSVASPEQNALLAQQALGTIDDSSATKSLLDDPDFLGDGVKSVERADPEAVDNKIFEALGNAPQVNESEINDIFAALDDLQTTAPSATIVDQQPQQLPQPADQMSDTDEDILLESMANMNVQEPRAPSTPEQSANTGVATLVDVIQTPLADDETLPQVTQVQDQTTSSVVDNTAIAALNDRMDLIMTRLESLANKVENLADSEPVLSAPAQGNDETVARLEKTIQTLEKRVATLANNKPSATTVKTAPKKASVAQSEKAYVPPKKTISWELRGASPNEAYVAQKGSQSVRTVKVGNSLDGIGRITSIAVEGGRWVVRGTSGIITQ